MAWYILVISFSLVFLSCALFAVFRRNNVDSLKRPVATFLLANSQLRQRSVINLIVSISFGLNPLFFQIWLGYSVGFWALITQAAWAIGFILLKPYAQSIRFSKSLHERIGINSINARMVAAFASLVGLMFMICWESKVGVVVFSDIINTSKSISLIESNRLAGLLISAVIGGTLFYTTLGGLRVNAKADIFLNIFKIILVLCLTGILINQIHWSSFNALYDKFFPSLASINSTIGWWGLLTNIIFSLSWQFVDNSTWQSLISGRDEEKNKIDKTLEWSGLVAFVAPGVIGTFLGVFLSLVPFEVGTGNMFSSLINLTGEFYYSATFIVALLSVACLMSMLDGLFLTSAYALVIDIMHHKESLQQLDDDPVKAQLVLTKVRIYLVIIAILAAWPLRYVMDVLKVGPFDYVYFVIISQLALFGPAFLSIASKRLAKWNISLAIIGSAAIGFLCAVVGVELNISWLKDGAGTFATICSLVFAFVSTTNKKSADVIA